MKKTLFLFILLFVLFSCKKNNIENKNNILLSKVIQDKYVKTFNYDSENKLIKIVDSYNNEITGTRVFHYKNNLCSYYEIYNGNDEITSTSTYEYFIDSGYYTCNFKQYNGNPVINYKYILDDSNRLKCIKIFEADELAWYEINTFDENTITKSYNGADSSLAGSLILHYDNYKNPFCVIPDHHKSLQHNIISINSDNLNEQGFIDIVFPANHGGRIESINLGLPYTNTYNYNNHGYPTKETRIYSNTAEPLVRLFEYIAVN